LKSSTQPRAFITVVDVKAPYKTQAIDLQESFSYFGNWGPAHEFYFVCLQDYYSGARPYTSLKRLDVDTMNVSEVTRFQGFMQFADPKPSPDGESIAVAVDVDDKRWTDYDSLVLVDAKSGELTRLTTEQDVNWDYEWRRDGQTLYFEGRNGGLDQIYRVDLNSHVTRVTKDDRNHFDLRSSPDGRSLSYQTEDGEGRKDIRVLSTEREKESVIAIVADPVKEFRLGAFRHVRWKSTDGLSIWGFLILPPDFDPSRKYPLYVDVHGGGPGSPLSLVAPLGSTLSSSPLEWHAWAAEGYVVFVPDMRSSGEYGPDVAAARYAAIDWDFAGIQKDIEDIETGTHWVLDQGYIDPNRVAIFGYSAGGARVNLLLTRSTLYRAGIIFEAIPSGALPSTIWATTGERTGVGFDENFTSRGKTFAQAPSVYTGGFLFEGYKSKTPTLILVGNPDKGACPTLSAEVLFSMLRQYKVPTRMVRYVDEGHGPMTVASALQRYNEIRKWLEMYIPPSPTTESALAP
jgi:dipeptidyl aminopeptidase/acylaminoacyl peptidase